MGARMPHAWVTRHHRRGREMWEPHCECGWTMRAGFADPDAAYHAARLHDAVVHPEMIDWADELRRFRQDHARSLSVQLDELEALWDKENGGSDGRKR